MLTAALLCGDVGTFAGHVSLICCRAHNLTQPKLRAAVIYYRRRPIGTQSGVRNG